jgi:hypothetical protein
MRSGTVGGDQAARTLRTALGVCLAGAAGAFLLLTAFASWRAGAAIAGGLVIGSGNGLLAAWTLGAGSFRMLSLGRLSLLTALGVGYGLLLGVDFLWLVALGLALAQLALTGAAVRETLRAR